MIPLVAGRFLWWDSAISRKTSGSSRFVFLVVLAYVWAYVDGLRDGDASFVEEATDYMVIQVAGVFPDKSRIHARFQVLTGLFSMPARTVTPGSGPVLLLTWLGLCTDPGPEAMGCVLQGSSSLTVRNKLLYHIHYFINIVVTWAKGESGDRRREHVTRDLSAKRNDGSTDQRTADLKQHYYHTNNMIFSTPCTSALLNSTTCVFVNRGSLGDENGFRHGAGAP
jgi:hypothetical protein